MKQAFDDLDSQYAELSAIRRSADGFSVPHEVKARLDRYRLTITCNATSALAFSGLCRGAPAADFNEMARRKQQMIQDLGLSIAPVTEKRRATAAAAALE